VPRFDRITRFDFALFIDEQGFDLATIDAGAFVSAWMSSGSEPELRVGPLIDVEDEPWYDEEVCDPFVETMAWFHAADAMIGGATIFGEVQPDGFRNFTGPWADSNLIWQRFGDILEMEDIHDVGEVALPRVQVPFVDFHVLLAGHAGRLAAFVRAARAEALGLQSSAPIDRLLAGLPDDEDLAVLDRVAMYRP
jgi:hypothetical protein